MYSIRCACYNIPGAGDNQVREVSMILWYEHILYIPGKLVTVNDENCFVYIIPSPKYEYFTRMLSGTSQHSYRYIYSDILVKNKNDR